MRLRDFCDLLRASFRDDLSAGLASFRSEVDHPIGGLDDIQIVFDDDEGIPGVY